MPQDVVADCARTGNPTDTVLSIMEQIAIILTYLHDPDNVDASEDPFPVSSTGISSLLVAFLLSKKNWPGH